MPSGDQRDERLAGSPIQQVRQRNEARLLAIDGAVRVDIGRARTGEEVIVVQVTDASARSRVPTEIEGHRVIAVSGEIDVHRPWSGEIDVY